MNIRPYKGKFKSKHQRNIVVKCRLELILKCSACFCIFSPYSLLEDIFLFRSARTSRIGKVCMSITSLNFSSIHSQNSHPFVCFFFHLTLHLFFGITFADLLNFRSHFSLPNWSESCHNHPFI